jgi:hypothetical protein
MARPVDDTDDRRPGDRHPDPARDPDADARRLPLFDPGADPARLVLSVRA